MGVDVGPRIGRIQQPSIRPDLAAYTLHVIRKNQTDFDVAYQRWMHTEPDSITITAIETVCFFCQHPTDPINTTIPLLGRCGQRTLQHIKRKCKRCFFTFKHSDISGGIMVFGSTAFTMGLMLDLDISFKNSGVFQPVWR